MCSARSARSAAGSAAGWPWRGLTLQGANFLLLDEPTNHLDLASQEILEDVLRQFPGTVLLVSHDRYLVQALATHVWRVAGDELRVYKGNYEEYLRQREIERAGMPAIPVASAATGVSNGRPDTEEERERARQERRLRKAAEKLAEQAAAMEAQISQTEAHMVALEPELEAASVAGDVARVQASGLRYQALDAELHRLMAAWAELD